MSVIKDLWSIELIAQYLSNTRGGGRVFTSVDAAGDTAFDFLIFPEDKELFRQIVRRENINVKWQDRDNQSLLHIALKNQMEEEAIYLITQGSDVELCSNNNVTPLMMACRHGLYRAVEKLVLYGADLDAFDNERNNALSISMSLTNEQVRDQILHFLMDQGARLDWEIQGKTILEFAIEKGQFNLAHILVDKFKCNINEYKKDGHTFLTAAISKRADNINDDLIDSLINLGIDIDRPNKYGFFPIIGALYAEKWDLVKKLINLGANLSTKDLRGNDVLTLSKNFNRDDIVKIISAKSYVSNPDATIIDLSNHHLQTTPTKSNKKRKEYEEAPKAPTKRNRPEPDTSLNRETHSDELDSSFRQLDFDFDQPQLQTVNSNNNSNIEPLPFTAHNQIINELRRDLDDDFALWGNNLEEHGSL
jgi:ankyrin repeat protein